MGPAQPAVGTVVATYRKGICRNDYSGRSHVYIYLGYDRYEPDGGNINASGIHPLYQVNGGMIDHRINLCSWRGGLRGRVVK